MSFSATQEYRKKLFAKSGDFIFKFYGFKAKGTLKR